MTFLTLAEEYFPLLNYNINGTLSTNGTLCSYNLSGGTKFATYTGYTISDANFVYSNYEGFIPAIFAEQDDYCNLDTTERQNSWYCNGYGGANCRFRPCIQTYTASIESGILTETLFEESDVDDDSWGLNRFNVDDIPYGGLIDLSRVTPQLSTQMREEGYDLEASGATRWMIFNITQDSLTTMINGSLRKSLFDAGALFVIDLVLYEYCIDAISFALDGAVNNSQFDEVFGTIFTAFDETEISSESIEDVMQNITKALNLILRSNGKAGFSHPALGIVNKYAVCVQVS